MKFESNRRLINCTMLKSVAGEYLSSYSLTMLQSDNERTKQRLKELNIHVTQQLRNEEREIILKLEF